MSGQQYCNDIAWRFMYLTLRVIAPSLDDGDTTIVGFDKTRSILKPSIYEFSVRMQFSLVVQLDRLADHPVFNLSPEDIEAIDNLPYQSKPTVFSIVANLKATIAVSAEEVKREPPFTRPAQSRIPKRLLSSRIRSYMTEASEWMNSVDKSIHTLAHRLVSQGENSQSTIHRHVTHNGHSTNLQLDASDSFGRLILHTISGFYGLSSTSEILPS